MTTISDFINEQQASLTDGYAEVWNASQQKFVGQQIITPLNIGSYQMSVSSNVKWSDILPIPSTTSGNGNTLTIASQSTSQNAGGNLIISSGSGNNNGYTNGSIHLQSGGTDMLVLESDGNKVSFGQYLSAPYVNQETRQTGPGTPLTIQAQNTNDNQPGGDLILTSGTGVLRSGQISLRAGGIPSILIQPTGQIVFMSSGICYQQSITTNSNYIITTADFIIYVDCSNNDVQLTLPANPTLGETHIIKYKFGKSSNNNISIVCNNANIDGSSTYVMNTNFAVQHIIYNGSFWSLI